LVIAADYPFMDVLWSMIIFFAWVAWIWILIVILTDVFRRHDIGGWTKALWTIFLVVIPFLGVLVYLVAQHDGMAERQQKDVQAQQAQFDSYVRQAAGTGGGAASEIEKAKALLDSGAITQSEFETLKAKAVA
jgi:general stress protein CsbA